MRKNFSRVQEVSVFANGKTKYGKVACIVLLVPLGIIFFNKATYII